MHIVHISSVHNAQDPRIRHKQMQSIHDHGWRVTLITGDMKAGKDDDPAIVPVFPGRDRRILRIALTAPRAIFQALKLKADIYHFHDPELLPWAFILRLKRVPVVYDIHEDYCSSVGQKPYLPNSLKPLCSSLAGWAESGLAFPFHQIIAERYYSKRFPRALPILNYPVQSNFADYYAFRPYSKKILYTGNLTVHRGALHMARFLRFRADFSLVAAGYCSMDLARSMRKESGSAAESMHITGEGRFVPFAQILDHYRNGGWLSGLALFPETEHYREKELTKFFEYMAVGLPIVASGFPVWRELIEDQGVGLCVNAEDPASVAQALDWLYDNPDKARSMGERGKMLVAEKYNWEQEGLRLLDFYERIT